MDGCWKHCRRVPPVLVGDVDQPPSGSAGNVPRDRVWQRQISPSCACGHSFGRRRQRYQTAAGEVLAGTVLRENDDVVLCECTEEEGREIILNSKARRKIIDPGAGNSAVRPADAKRPCGTEANAALQLAANPDAAGEEQRIRIGHKVMQIVNTCEKDVWLTAISARSCRDEANRRRGLSRARAGVRRLGAAGTGTCLCDDGTQKPGSEYDTVILALFGSQSRMLQRNLLYTAITRCEEARLHRRRTGCLGQGRADAILRTARPAA